LNKHKPEEFRSAAHLVSNDKPPFSCALYFEDLDNGAMTGFYIPHNLGDGISKTLIVEVFGDVPSDRYLGY